MEKRELTTFEKAVDVPALAPVRPAKRRPARDVPRRDEPDERECRLPARIDQEDILRLIETVKQL